MDQVMKTLVLTLFLMHLLSASSQTWRSVDVKGMNPFSYTYSGGGTSNNRYFRINPYNNEIWLTHSDAIQLLDNNGQYSYYNNSNTSLFPANASFRDFAFTADYTFALSGNYGLYQRTGNDWSLAIPFDEGVNLNYDVDTVWCIRDGENYIKWQAGLNSQSTVSVCSKAISRNGLFWGGAQYDAVFRVEDDQQYVLYSPDTSKLMDWGNWDMKFYPGTDSLFVANNGGLAIADGSTFVDSICASNCMNMPLGKILEFEFDANKNIWALIGNAGQYDKTGLAHYDVATKVWDQYYDENNSPILFGGSKVSIEMDNLGNLWVIDNLFLWVLDEGNAPAWVGIKENETISVSLAPNPTKDIFTVSFEGNTADYTLYEAQGKLIQTSTILSGEAISLSDVQTGVYFFELTTENGKTVKRVVKN
jgi:hypothetical protein